MTQRPRGSAARELQHIIDVELPAHLRAFAAAHAAGAPVPPAPAGLGSAAIVAHVLEQPALEQWTLARLCLPIAIESSPEVATAWAAAVAGSWPEYAHLVAARDRVARRRFGADHVALLHALMGIGSAPAEADAGTWPARLEAWHAAQAEPAAPIDAVWRAFGSPVGLRNLDSTTAHPRAFVVRPRAEVIVVARVEVRSPCDRFGVLHELGHALAALIADPVPRVVDEAVAAYLARHQEVAGLLPPGWASPVAVAARERRIAVARRLDAIERARPLGAVPASLTRPPWALVHDPGAQAVYIAAQPIADRWWTELGPLPAPRVLAAAIAAAARTVEAAAAT